MEKRNELERDKDHLEKGKTKVKSFKKLIIYEDVL